MLGCLNEPITLCEKMSTKDALTTNAESKCADAEVDRLFVPVTPDAKADQANIEADDDLFANHITWRTAVPQVSTSTSMIKR